MILEDILIHKRREIEELKLRFPLERLKDAVERHPEPCLGFSKKFRTHPTIHIIAEIKRASPSAGVLKEDFNPLTIARLYEAGGASALSVITETRFFLGRPSYVKTVRSVSSLPILRKDFIIDPYQIYESRVLSADAVLLIADILTLEELLEFRRTSEALGMDALIEVNSEEDLEKAVCAGASLIGINNRNLRTLRVDPATAERLIPRVPKRATLVVESGLESYEDIMRLKSYGVLAFLVGSSLMKSPNIIAKLHELRGIGRAD